MAINWDTIEKITDGAGKDFLVIVKPYLPALARAGQGLFDGFIKHAMDRDWASVNKLMYEHMTTTERRELEDQAIADLRQAAIDRYDRIELTKDLGFKLALKVIMLIIA